MKTSRYYDENKQLAAEWLVNNAPTYVIKCIVEWCLLCESKLFRLSEPDIETSKLFTSLMIDDNDGVNLDECLTLLQE